MAEDPFKAMNLSRREYLSKFGQSVIDSPNSNISDREDALVVKEGLSNQRGREAQQQFYDVAPNAREAFLEDNAVISASPQFGQVQGYMGEVRRGPTYADNVLRKSIASNLPAAYRGRFEELVDAGAGVNEARTQVELEKDDEDLGLSLIDAGIHPDEVEKLRNPETGIIDQKQARWMKSQKSRETTSRGESPAIKAMKEEYDYLAARAKRIVDTKYLGIAPGVGEDAAYDAAVADMESLGQQMSAARRSIFSPPSRDTVDTTTDWAAADAAEVGLQGVPFDPARPLKENLAKAAGGGEVFPDQPKPPLVSGATAPQEYLTRIKAKGISQAERVAAYEQFKSDFESGKIRPSPHLKGSEAIAEGIRTGRMVEEAAEEVEFAPVKEGYDMAWTEAKKTVMEDIDKFAKSIGLDSQQVINSIATEDQILVPDKYGKHAEYMLDLFENFSKRGYSGIKTLVSTVPALKPFKESKFADRLGMGFFSSGAKTWRDVLDDYVEKSRSAQSAPATVPPSAEDPPKIKKITILP